MGLVIAIAVFLVLLFFVERAKPDLVTRIEENVLATILATMTLVSFAQVIARYGFNTGWGGALEFTRILFAWMILFGMSYGIKIGSHLGVDAVIRLLPKKAFKATALFGALCGVLYGAILLYGDWLQFFGADARGGAIDYWNKFFKIGIGLDDLRYPEWVQESFGIQERVQRWVAYLVLPLGLALFSFRCAQAFFQIWRGDRDLMIAGHEAEDLVAENISTLRD
ncbi:MAG: TRAP transporter small permease [Rhodospirillaceae bacterium]|nr:TRAP transporter small permease [Rhodospirillaceae bacterium]